jgi:hypothetical protein
MVRLVIWDPMADLFRSINEIAPNPAKSFCLLQINNGVFVKVTKATQPVLLSHISHTGAPCSNAHILVSCFNILVQ